jgi:predicted dehydrogenase
MKPVRTAVVGVGHLGRHHLRWLHDLPESELVGLYDIDGEKGKKYARQYNVTAFDSLKQLADQVEAVSVVVPTTAHAEVASFLIERGIHCLIEKPVAATLTEAERLKMLAEKQGVKVTVGHIERFNPAVTALREYDICPSFIEAHRLAPFDPRGTDVAVVLDLMIHDIDLTLMFINSPVADIQASAVAVVTEQADIANARLTFADGAVANLTASRISLKEMRKLRLFQKSGYFSLDLARKQADIYRLADRDTPMEGMRFPLGKSNREIVYQQKNDTGDDMLQMELRSFLEAVACDRPVAVTLEEAVEALRVALEIDRRGREALSRMLATDSS